MRNTLISLVTVILVAIYSVFSFFYIDSFVESFEGSVNAVTSDSPTSYQDVETAKENLKGKKNMLLLMISKEHIDNIENYLSSLGIAVKFKNPQDIEEYKILLLNSIENVKEHNATIN